MAIFDANKVMFLTYYIVLTDPDVVAAEQAKPSYIANGGLNQAPYDPGPPAGGAAIAFSAPFKGYAQLTLNAAPYIWTPWSGVGSQGGPYPLNVATFQRHTGGFLGIGGTTVRYYWLGIFVLGATTTPVETGGPVFEKALLAKRLLLEGFEMPFGGAAGSAGGVSGLTICRDASRHVGGYGLAMRGAITAAPLQITTYDGAATPAGQWARLYVRLRKLSAGSVSFLRLNGTPSVAAGLSFLVTSSGQIAVENVDSGSVHTLLGTCSGAPLTVWDGTALHGNGWRRIDLCFTYNAGVTDPLPAPTDYPGGGVYVFIDGEVIGHFQTASTSDGVGLGGIGQDSSRLQGYQLGNNFAGANTLELDLDDFVSCNLPEGRGFDAYGNWGNPWHAYAAGPPTFGDYVIGNIVVGSDNRVYKCILANRDKPPSRTANATYWHHYEGFDWLNGSKISLVRPLTFGSAHDAAGWNGGAPDVRLLAQRAFGTPSTTTPEISSTTALAQLDVDTDAAVVVDGEKMALGLVAFVVAAFQTRGTTSGNLGWSLNGAITDTAIVQQTTAQWNGLLYTVDGATVKDPVDITPFKMRHQKGNDVSAARIRSILAQVEMIGQFGAEDFRVLEAAAGVVPTFPRFVGQHNAPYPYSQWAVDAAAAPIAPYIVKGGTYAGNSTGQDLLFRAPVHLLFVRPLTGGAGGGMWGSTFEASHHSFNEQSVPGIIGADEDPTFAEADGEDAQQQRFRVRIGGLHAQYNVTGVTYQYIAICDPGARFSLNGAFSHKSNLTAVVDNPLIDPTFLAGWGFFFVETLDASTAKNFWAKGPGQAAATVSPFTTTAALASALTLALGKLTSDSAWHALSGVQTMYSLWRRQDGNNDPGEAGAVAFGNYLGDGSASRTVSMAPATGKRPLFGLVFSEAAATGFWRDPSHTTTNSTNNVGTDTATGITGGGIDSFSVGSALNTNGVVYTWFILFADATAGNGGWGVNGEYFPVEANAPASGPWPVDPPEPVIGPGDEPPPVDDVPPGGPDPDLTAACVGWTQRLVNLGLARIGVTKQIADLAAEMTAEAATARLIITPAVDATLRDFPWPFATRYADLVLVGGTALVPVNNDWQYSYRAPADMSFGRRMARAGNLRAFEADPIEFKTGSDAAGGLIYSNEPNTATPLVLEYTVRMSCPAFQGDALFRNTLAWRFAAELAPGLSRDPKRQQYAWAMYYDALRKADTSAANEQQATQPDTHDADWIAGR